MKRTIKIAVCIFAFLLSLVGFDLLLNRGNTDMTMEMSKATYPTVSFKLNGHIINSLQGYKDEMNPAYMRDSITPLSEGRSLSVVIDKYGRNITGLAYEVRSLDGERLVEKTELYNYIEKTDTIQSTFSLKDLVAEGEEYSLIFLLTTDEGETLRYYTRVILDYDYKVNEKIDFAFDFSRKTFLQNEEGEEIIVFLESDSTGDNSTYQKVNIHSSYSQISWGDLDVTQETTPVATIQEIASQTASIELRYVVSVPEGRTTHYYNVTEYFRMRYGSERMYLLEYDRTMNQMFFEEEDVYFGNKIVMGITDENIELSESDDGNTFAFVSEDALFCGNITSNKIARVFSFYDEDNFDSRTLNPNHDIKILNVDEVGNVSFMVYGYMNRGSKEGQVGILVYTYNSILNTIEEELFIPYNRSFALLKANLENLSFLNKTNDLFLYLDGMIYCVNLETKEYEVVVNKVTDDNFKVSDDNVMLVWESSQNAYNSQELTLMNLNTKKTTEITADYGKRILPLGFMGEDLIYGLAYERDIYMDSMGNVIFPMHTVKIQNEFGRVLKSYEQEGYYCLECIVEGNMITMTRVQKAEEGEEFVEAPSDTILNNQTETVGKNSVETVVTENFKRTVQIVLRNELDNKTIKVAHPKEVLYEGSRELEWKTENSEKYYYVYSRGEIIGIYTEPAQAIRDAYDIAGSVINVGGDYVWIKGNRLPKNQIMAISGEKATETTSSLAVCLNTILSYEGYSKSTEEQIEQGYSPLAILQTAMPDADVLDLSGCNLESMLYYVNQDIPVLVMMEDQSAILLIGFNDLNTVWMDPATGTVFKVGMKDSTELFNENGNQFITYIRAED